MRPVLFTFDVGLGPVPVASYDAALFLAVAVVLALGVKQASHRGLPRRAVLIVLLAAGVASFVGARVVHTVSLGLTHTDFFSSLCELRPRGFAFSGGILAAMAVGWLVGHRQGVDPWRLADSLTIPIALGVALLRRGCFLQVCCYGGEAKLPGGVTFPLGSPAHLLQMSEGLALWNPDPAPVHPTQLYELVSALLTAVLASILLRRPRADGLVAIPCALGFLGLREIATGYRAFAGPSLITTSVLGALLLVLLVVRVGSPVRSRDSRREDSATDSA